VLQSQDENTCLHLACEKGWLDVVTVLVTRGGRNLVQMPNKVRARTLQTLPQSMGAIPFHDALRMATANAHFVSPCVTPKCGAKFWFYLYVRRACMKNYCTVQE
jgi:hypothetical protein